MQAYIEGIYCYCDQCCERCLFTERCAVFAGSAALADTGPESAGFWEKLLAQFAASHGHIPDVSDWEIEVRQPTAAEIAHAKAAADALEVRLGGEAPLALATAWQQDLVSLMEDRSYWRAHARSAARQAAMGIRSAGAAMQEAETVTEHLRVLRHSSELMNDRLRAALSASYAPDAGCHAGDPDGLAKVALVAVRQSRAALAGLFGIFSDEDRLLPLFASLSALERAIDERFPEAWSFVRPGFDEPMAARRGGL